jgi:hypothetical protein
MRSVRILSIGNSFSEDSLAYLWPLLKESGFDQVILGHLMIGGASLFDHHENLSHDRSAYQYYKSTDGTWNHDADVTMFYGLKDADWDIITIQQVSALSGIKETYQPDLNALIDFIDRHKTNASACIIFHMTWAYQEDSTHGGFAFYDHSQTHMIHSIHDAVKSMVLKHPRIKMIIPTGTAIQNARKVYGDVLTRDGFHLSLPLGRLIAATTWAMSLVQGHVFDGASPIAEIDQVEWLRIKEISRQAVEHPFEITDMSVHE